jgi:Zn-dependent M28 family amino/carboxypeptidase
MRPAIVMLLASLLAWPACAATHFDGVTWWDTVRVLADDGFEGRDTGSPGERAARRFLAHRLAAAGIPAVEQPIELRSRTLVEADSSMTLLRDGQEIPLALGEQAFFSTRVDLAPHVDAPLVFVGYGLTVADAHHDDFAGLDLRGAIAVVISGSPASMSTPLAAHAQSAAERWKAIRAAGAIGMLLIPNPASMDIPWSRMAINRSHPSMVLVGKEFDDSAGAQFSATVNPAHAELLFEGTGHRFSEIAALARDRQPLPRFVLPTRLRASTHLESRAVHSANLIATVRGGDPALRDEYVVLSAHLDHLGIGEPIRGDRINNGAMDNASGSALLLDVASSLAHERVKPRRSVLFVWVTGEEKGLLGSRYFASHPTVPVAHLVADVNTDMFLPIVPLQVLTVYGLEESDLGGVATRVAHAFGYRTQGDGEPLRNLFVRSDQYSFIKRGIPSLSLKVGYEPGSVEEAVMRRWLSERYHAPSDDAGQPVDLAAAAGFEEVIRELAVRIANEPTRPSWNDDSFFRIYEVGRAAVRAR